MYVYIYNGEIRENNTYSNLNHKKTDEPIMNKGTK